MRIALRTSGGRGEYELAGQHAGLSYRDLLGRSFVFQLSPSLEVSANCQVHYDQAKPRIRLNNVGTGIHPYRIIAAVLLLPAPKRELSQTGDGALEIAKHQYSITSIPVQILQLRPAEVVFSISVIELANRAGRVIGIDTASRLSTIFELWRHAADRTDEISDRLNAHRQAMEVSDAKLAEKAQCRAFATI